MARDGGIDDREAALGAPRTEAEPAEADDAAPSIVLPRTLDARALLGDARVLHIEHAGEIYTLRLTRNDRLILTK